MLRPFLLSWLTILALAALVYLASFQPLPFPTPHTSSRFAAALFLVGVILLGIAEFGWGGGDLSKK